MPFAKQYVLELLPDEYKQKQKVDAGRLGGEASGKLSLPKSSGIPREENAISEPSRVGLKEVKDDEPVEEALKKAKAKTSKIDIDDSTAECIKNKQIEFSKKKDEFDWLKNLSIENFIKFYFGNSEVSQYCRDSYENLYPKDIPKVKETPKEPSKEYARAKEEHHIIFKDEKILLDGVELLSESFQTTGPALITVKVELNGKPVVGTK